MSRPKFGKSLRQITEDKARDGDAELAEKIAALAERVSKLEALLAK